MVTAAATLRGDYPTAGDRTIGLQVCNEGGCDTDSVVLSVEAPIGLAPPVINLIGCLPVAVQVGDRVRCDPTVDGDVDSYAWRAGGQTGSRSTFSVTFAIAGTRSVSLEACNDDGCDLETAEIEVTTTPPDDPPELDLSSTSFTFGTSSSDSLTIENVGGQTLGWAITGLPAWLAASPTSGTTTSGSSTVTLTVDRSGFGAAATDPAAFSITSNGGNANVSVSALPLPPVVSISCVPTTVAPGESTLCSASNSGGTIGSYEWSDDEGGTGAEATFLTSFAGAGTLGIDLTATNAGGSGGSSSSVTVVVPTHTMTIGASTGTGTGSVSGGGPYTEGATATLTATGTGGSTFVSWGGDCAGIANPLDVLMDANKTCSAEFAAPVVEFTMTIGASTGTGTGSVSGGGPYTEGATATLTATGTGGSTFVSWGGDCAGIANPLDVLMDANKTCSAEFAAPVVEFTMTIGASTGTGTGSVSGGGPYTEGATATLTATGTGDSTFVSWGGDCAGIANPLDVLMDANKTCSAEFAAPVVSLLAEPQDWFA